MNPDIQRALEGASSGQSGRMRRRLMPACLLILSAVAIWIVLLRREVPEADLARVVAVGNLKTNGEHWVIFRFDAPPKKSVQIVNVQVIGRDNFPANPYPFVPTSDSSVLSMPDSRVPIFAVVKAGSSKQLKVRQTGGGEWRVRLCLMLHLELGKQFAARIKGCWRAKSLKLWTRSYVEKNYRIIESEVVTTTDSGIPRASRATPPASITP